MNNIETCLRDTCDKVDNVKFYPKYSGRGMYGRECIGIVGSHTDCMNLIAEVIKNAALEYEDNRYKFNDIVDTLMNSEHDNMGYDIIMYWRKLQFSGIIESEED